MKVRGHGRRLVREEHLADGLPHVSGDDWHLFTQQCNLEQLLDCSNFHLGCRQHWWWDRRACGDSTFPKDFTDAWRRRGCAVPERQINASTR